MSWREQIEPDWFHEAPFYLAAIIAHGALISFNPVINWGGLIAPEKAIPVEFVADIPLPPIVQPPEPARVSPGSGDSEPTPKLGPGEFKPKKVKQGAVDAPPKPKPVPKPAAVKSKVRKQGATVHKAKTIAKPKSRAKLAVDAQAVKFAREAQAESRRLRVERDRAARAARAAKASAERERQAAAARVQAERRAEVKAEQERFAAAQKAERERRAAVARAEAERRAEAAREAAREAAERKAAALAEQRRLAAEEKAARAAKRAELSSALATMADPDEALDAGEAPAPSGRGSARKGRPAAGGPVSGAAQGGAELAGARKAAAAAALAESPDPGDASGRGGADIIDTKASGGGVGPDGGGVSFSLDGSVGNRRILKRVSPTSPDWVATRSLDLTVTVRFQILPDGRVKPGAVIQKTSGFPDIDTRAIKALGQWRFQPVEAKPGAAEVWGRVTFRFTS